MKSYLPFVLESSTLFFIAFVVVLNVVIPLLADLPLFWMFTKRRRLTVDRKIGWLIGRIYNTNGERVKPTAKTKKEKQCRTQTT